FAVADCKVEPIERQRAIGKAPGHAMERDDRRGRDGRGRPTGSGADFGQRKLEGRAKARSSRAVPTWNGPRWARFASSTLRFKLQLRRSSIPTFLFTKCSV